jgi:succinyl-CoA synthetase beta subunit
MARLHEYQGKAILAANGFKIPRGRAASTADDAVAAAKELAGGRKGSEVVIKIRAWTTGRAGTMLSRSGAALQSRLDFKRKFHALKIANLRISWF